ncbi:MAG: hypothetical protein JW715_16725 [Sedimentisphaerales bacterium]|nr:hypothetical protein [Sedimentisphaerales bacterium]
MRPSENIEKKIQNIPFNTNAQKDKEILEDILNAMGKTKNQQSAFTWSNIWRIIMKNNISKLVATFIIIAVVLSLLVIDKFNAPAWALSDTIEALKDLKAVYVVGAYPGGTAEIWMRSDETGSYSTDSVVRNSQGAITWTKDGSTYHYEPGQNTVYFENAITLGFSQWLGPELLEMFSKADNTETIRGKDPATGRERVTMICSMIDSNGPQSWMIEFDLESKLPVAFKQWPNLDRSGQPAFEAFKITYYENLPDSFFEVNIPGKPTYTEKPLTIPDENVSALSNPRDGISIEGLSQQEAAEKTVRILFQAVIDQDLDQLRQIAPLSRNLGDDFIRSIVFEPDKDDRITEIVKIGKILKTGHSKLGTIAAVPVILKLQNGKKTEEKMIIQFRRLGGKSTCVVHGPYGLSREIE